MAARVLVIGVGSIGHRHLRCLGITQRATLSICETNTSLKNELAAQYGVEQAFDSLDEALQDPPDMAVICTPAHLHVSMARQLVAAGVHVLIEKPLGTSLDGVEALVEEAKQQRRVVGVAYVLRFNPLLATLRELIATERYGTPVQLTVVSGQHFPFYRPAYREIYYKDRATGGGAIQDGLTHIVNACQWIFGDIQSLVADADHKILDGVTVEDTVHVIARHGNTMASYSMNQHQAPNESTLTVNCTAGTIRCEFHKQTLQVVEAPEQPWQTLQETSLERDDAFIAQAHGFLDAVTNDQPVSCTLQEARQTLRANLAILQSVDAGFDRFAY
ncbi:MAG: Gfo/Idh/MocA family oxidoreductase [Pirellulaceae bacterium]